MKQSLDLYLSSVSARLSKNLSSVLSNPNVTLETISDCLQNFALTIQITLHNLGSLFLFHPFSEIFYSESKATPDKSFDGIEDEDVRHEVGLFYGVIENLSTVMKHEVEEGKLIIYLFSF